MRGVEVEVLEGMAELESQKRKIDCRDYEWEREGERVTFRDVSHTKTKNNLKNVFGRLVSNALKISIYLYQN